MENIYQAERKVHYTPCRVAGSGRAFDSNEPWPPPPKACSILSSVPVPVAVDACDDVTSASLLQHLLYLDVVVCKQASHICFITKNRLYSTNKPISTHRKPLRCNFRFFSFWPHETPEENKYA